MTNPMVRIHNTETNEIIDREMNDTEFAQYKKDQAEAALKAEADAEAASKRETALFKLAALGLTTDDLAALGL